MNDSNKAQAAATKERTALISVIMDLAFLGPSIIVAVLANSMTLYADLLGDLNVFIANAMLLFIIYKMRKGMGNNFDYGAGKVENLIGVIGGWFVVLSIGYILYTSIGRILSPVPLDPAHLAMGAVVMLASMIASGYLWIRNYRIYKRIPSPVTDIQWRVPMSDTVIAGGILVSLLAMIFLREYAWSRYIDPVISLALGGVIIYSFYGLIKTSLFDLLDRTLEEKYQMIITRELAKFYHDYAQLHGVRSRRTGSSVFIEIFLEFDPDRKVGEIHEVIETMRKSLEEKIENSFVSISLSKKSVR
ncbi:cation diffusion facilitator family transporter [Desulfonatronovibrio magnus]|uniref:cation diffusion facilitator family transporter n=1 Tax=Desulfonatronovibrio magnus TaxID=698827 RepID=UPI0005EBCE39|nr:cation diffusion facilitator family transporter [Desulfonatronovibrio magnus]